MQSKQEDFNILSITLFVALVIMIIAILHIKETKKIARVQKVWDLQSREEEAKKAIINEMKPVLDKCSKLNPIYIEGKCLIWDMRENSSEACGLPEHMRASSSDSPITIIMVTPTKQRVVGHYAPKSVLGSLARPDLLPPSTPSPDAPKAVRLYLDLHVAYWPEKKAGGKHSIVINPPDEIDYSASKVYGAVCEPIAQWIMNLPQKPIDLAHAELRPSETRQTSTASPVAVEVSPKELGLEDLRLQSIAVIGGKVPTATVSLGTDGKVLTAGERIGKFRLEQIDHDSESIVMLDMSNDERRIINLVDIEDLIEKSSTHHQIVELEDGTIYRGQIAHDLGEKIGFMTDQRKAIFIKRRDIKMISEQESSADSF